MWWGHRQFFVATRRSFLNSFTTAPEIQIYTGIHSFTFSGFSESNIVLDITHADGSKICLDRRWIQDSLNVKKIKIKNRPYVQSYKMYNSCFNWCQISKHVRFDGNNYVRVNIIILILLLEWKYPKIKK